MNTIDDLRGSLEGHASGLADHDLHVRPVAVRERIRVVRRRRQAVGGAVLALVVAAVGTGLAGTLGHPDQPAPAGRLLAGATAPRTITSLGYTYAFATGAQHAGAVEMELPASDEPRLVSWATSGDDAVTLTDAYGEDHALDTPDFGDFFLVPPGARGTLRVSGTEGDVGLAVYDLTDLAPPGVTRDGITFRETVAEDRLVGAGIGDEGQAEVSATVPVVAGETRLKIACRSGERTVWAHTEVNGRPAGMLGGRGACSNSGFDPGGTGTYSLLDLTKYGDPGDEVTVTVRLTETQKSEQPLDDETAVVGFGLYRSTAPEERLAGTTFDRLVESGGHTYRLVADAEGTGPDVTVAGLAGHGLLRFSVVFGDDGVQVRGVDYGDDVMRTSRSSAGGIISIDPVQGGPDEATLRFRGDDPEDRMGLAVFEAVD